MNSKVIKHIMMTIMVVNIHILILLMLSVMIIAIFIIIKNYLLYFKNEVFTMKWYDENFRTMGAGTTDTISTNIGYRSIARSPTYPLISLRFGLVYRDAVILDAAF